MLKFDIRFDLPANILAEPATMAEHILAIQAAKDTAPYVPALTGSLSNRTKVQGGEIIYPGPYARYLYYGKLMVDPETGSAWAKKGATKKVLKDRNLVFNTTMHSMAQSHWFEASKAVNMERWERVAGKAMKRELNG